MATFEHVGVLNSTDSYNRAESVTLPPAVVGEYYVFVCADADNDVIETGREDNNCSAAPETLDVTAFEPDLAIYGVTTLASGFSNSS